MAPEVLMRKRDFNEKADIFSIGVIAFNLITGDDLFDVSSMEELKLKVCNYDPNYDGFSEFVTPDCINFLKKCLERDPLRR
jgi:serine/threonine protein kinase